MICLVLALVAAVFLQIAPDVFVTQASSQRQFVPCVIIRQVERVLHFRITCTTIIQRTDIFYIVRSGCVAEIITETESSGFPGFIR